MKSGQTAKKSRSAAPPPKGQDNKKGQEKSMASKAKAKAEQTEAAPAEKDAPETPGYSAAAARPVRCGRQEDDQAGQEARLRHP